MELLKTLRAQSIRRTLVPVLILWAFAVLLFFVFSGPDAIRSFFPKKLEELTPETLEGAYVEDDIHFIYAQYVEEEEYQDHKPTGKITGGEFLIDFDEVSYMGLFAHADRLSEANSLMNASWGVMDGTTDPGDLPVMHVRGTVVPMSSQEKSYYYELADGDSEFETLLLPCYINVDRIGSETVFVAYLLTAVSFILAVWGLLLLIKALRGGYQKKLRAKLEAIGGGELLLERLDHFYAEAPPLHGVRLDSEFVLFSKGAESVLLRPWEIAWAYQSTTQHRTNGIPTGKTYCCVLRTMDGMKYDLSMPEAKVQELLEAIQARLPGVVLGYAPEIEQLYQQDRDAFRARWEKARPGTYSLTGAPG